MVVGLRLQPLSSLSCLVEVRCLLARAPKEISLLTITEDMAEGTSVFFSAMRLGLALGSETGVLSGAGVGLAAASVFGLAAGGVVLAMTGMGLAALGFGVALGLATVFGFGVALGLLLTAPLV